MRSLCVKCGIRYENTYNLISISFVGFSAQIVIFPLPKYSFVTSTTCMIPGMQQDGWPLFFVLIVMPHQVSGAIHVIVQNKQGDTSHLLANPISDAFITVLFFAELLQLGGLLLKPHFCGVWRQVFPSHEGTVGVLRPDAQWCVFVRRGSGKWTCRMLPG